MKQKITPFLWFDGNAEEAMNFYVETFKNAKILNMSRYPESMPEVGGKVMTGSIEIEGQNFHVLNGGPMFQFTPAISFFVSCENQEEVDDLWYKLIANGGEPSRCGWLKDQFGLSWQIIPTALGKLMGDSNRVKSSNVMQAMMLMTKIDVAKLQEAYDKE